MNKNLKTFSKPAIFFSIMLLIFTSACANQKLDKAEYSKLLTKICSEARTEQNDLFQNEADSDEENLRRYDQLESIVNEETEAVSSLKVDDSLESTQTKLNSYYKQRQDATLDAIKIIQDSSGNLEEASNQENYTQAVEKIGSTTNSINSIYEDLDVDCQ